MDMMSLKVLSWDETRGFESKKSPDPRTGLKTANLVPTINSVVLIHAKFQDGPPFTFTVDGNTFWDAIAPFMTLSPSWDHVYLLGWYDESGKAFLTTWDGDKPVRSFVVTGVDSINMPLWNAPVPKNAAIHAVPMGKDPQIHARELGGFHAIGWWVPKNERKSQEVQYDSRYTR